MKALTPLVTATTCAVALLIALPAEAVAPVRVTVGGQSYDVSLEGDPDGIEYDNNNSGIFGTPPSGKMPWWGNSALAQQFATAVGDSFGKFAVNKLGEPDFGPFLPMALTLVILRELTCGCAETLIPLIAALA